MRKYFYAAVAAVALMMASCAQKTPAEVALDNYKACMEKAINFDGDDEEWANLMEEAGETSREFIKYLDEYDQETIAEMEKLSDKATQAVAERVAKVESQTAADIEDALAEDLEDAMDALGENF